MKTRKNQKKLRTLTYKQLRIPYTILPAGTLLFRSVKDINSDFAGIPQTNGTYVLTQYHNVFFYPYPFVQDLHKEYYNKLEDYNYSVEVYNTLHPIKLVSLVSPSPFTRGERKANRFLTDCKKAFPAGRSYDPCFMKDFLYKHPDIDGMEAVVRDDGNKFREAIARGEISTEEESYLHFSTNTRKKAPANSIKEYILYPLKKRYNTIIKDVDSWKKTHKHEFLYDHVISLSRADKNKEIHDFMKTKAQFNPITKLWSLKK